MQLCPPEMGSEIDTLGSVQIESWMEKNLTLVKMQFDKTVDPMVVELFELFLQCKLRPLFEGASRGSGSQKKLESLDPRAMGEALARLAANLKKDPSIQQSRKESGSAGATAEQDSI